MGDWTEPERLLEHVQNAAREKQLALIDTEYKPKLSPEEIEYLGLIARLKAWNDKQAELMRKESERER